MIVIRHRVNTVKDLKETPQEYGVEVDIRTWGRQLMLHHDPFQEGELLEDFLSNYNHSFIILESKVERIEPFVIDMAKKYGIKDYFLLSVNPPFMWKLMKENITKKMSVRFSELESVETCKLWAGKADWVWVDTWTKLPLDRKSYDELKKHFRICLVSPEMLNRPHEIPVYRRFFADNGMEIDAVCTDNCEDWK